MKKNKSWYSVILSVLMVWFMIVLTSWIFLLVLWENKDTKAMEYYLKSFAWAEWAVEIALLKAKKYNYSFSEKLNIWDNLSKALFRWWSNLYNFNKDVFISYDLDATSNEVIDKKLKSQDFDIIPLFYYDSNWNYIWIKDIITEKLTNQIVWNIVWEDNWISWIWNINNTSKWNYKTISGPNISFSEEKVWDFLNNSKKNYLILHNTSNDDLIYNIKTINPSELLTKDISYIIWTWEVWWYKQNLKVSIDNSQYLNLLKYSIFSN